MQSAINLTGRGNIKGAAATARRHQRRLWLSDWQAPTLRVTTRPPRRQFICLSGIICSNHHSAPVRYRYNAGINRPPPSPPLSSQMPIAGEFKCLQRTEHHGTHLDSTHVHWGIGNCFATSKWTGRHHCGLEGRRVDNPRHLGWQQGRRRDSS